MMNDVQYPSYYPACHSMDSYWFAVDKNGHIGFFDTGSEGPLPISFDAQEDSDCPECFFDYTPEIKGRLHQLYLPEPTVQKILENCSEEAAAELSKGLQNNKYVFFEGFILLREGFTWQDLNIQQALDKTNYDFAFKISDKHELYYISSICNITEEIAIPLENKIIKAVCNIRTREYEFFDSFFFDHDWGSHSPYQKIHKPSNPINVNVLNKEVLNKAVCFHDVDFGNNDEYFQPVKHTSCRSYWNDDEINAEGDAILLDDDARGKIICRLSPADYTYYKTGTHRCNICNPDFSRYDFFHQKSVSHIDFPPVFFLHEKHEYDPTLMLWKPVRLIERLGLNKPDVYTASCVKCTVANGDDPNAHLPAAEQLAIRFKNCFFRLEEELRYLRPAVLVCYSSLEYGLLESIFKIIPDKERQYFYTIECADRTFPLLYIGDPIDSVSDESFAEIKKRLSFLCRQKRDLPDFKRVL